MNWNTALTIVSLLIAVIAVMISIAQMHQNNKLTLFDRRLNAFLKVEELLDNYKHNCRDVSSADHFSVNNHNFYLLTNSSTLEKITEVIDNVLIQEYQYQFLHTLEDLNKTSVEFAFVFKSGGKEISNFISKYKAVLNEVYKYQIIINKVNQDLKQPWSQPSTKRSLEKSKKNIGEEKHRQRLIEAYQELEKTFQEVIESKATEKISKKLKL